jgi:tripartite ATP-independent transporter DctM subunit
MTRGKISRALIDLSSSLVGSFTGGLAHVNILASMVFGTISGSAVADAASLGSIMIPEMVARGYKKDFSVAVISTSASIAILIPPSIPMIIYAVVANVSIARMFLAGFIPGVVYGLSLMITSYFIAKREGFPAYEPFSIRNVWKKSQEAAGAALIPITILGGIYGGLATTTEVAALAAVMALFLSLFWYKGVELSEVPQIMLTCGKRAGAVLMILSMSIALSWYLTREGVPQQIAAVMMSVTTNKSLIILIVVILLTFCGMVLHGGSMIIMLVPILLPLMEQVGMDPIHFGVFFTMMICVGEQTPPVASVLLTSCAVAGIAVADTMKALMPLLITLYINALLVAYVPAVSLFLPNLLLGHG